VIPLRLVFTLILFPATMLDGTVLGHPPEGWLDILSVASGVFGLVAAWRLARKPRSPAAGLATLVVVLGIASILPVRLAIQILIAMSRT